MNDPNRADDHRIAMKNARCCNLSLDESHLLIISSNQTTFVDLLNRDKEYLCHSYHDYAEQGNDLATLVGWFEVYQNRMKICLADPS